MPGRREVPQAETGGGVSGDFDDLTDADFDPAPGEPATDATTDGSGAEMPAQVGAGSPDAEPEPVTVPCPIPGCGATIAAEEPFKALAAHLEDEHGLVPTDEPEPTTAPPPQLVLPVVDEFSGLFGTHVDPQTGEVKITANRVEAS